MNVNEAIAAVKANPPHSDSPLPWYNDSDGVLYCRTGYEVCGPHGHGADHRCIAAAVNAAPLLIAEVERLVAAVATAERLRAEDGMELTRCQSVTREWQVAAEFADARAVKAGKEVDRLQAQLAAARVAVGNLPPYPHTQLRCSPSEGCHCTSDASNTARTEARRALGLEVGNG